MRRPRSRTGRPPPALPDRGVRRHRRVRRLGRPADPGERLLAAGAGGRAGLRLHRVHPLHRRHGGDVFSGIGVGMLFMVTAVGRTHRAVVDRRPRGSHDGYRRRLAWFLVAGHSLALYTSVGWWLSEAAPDPELQQALYQTLGISMTGAARHLRGRHDRVARSCSAPPGAGLAWSAGRSRSWRPAAAVISAGTFLFPFAPPWGSIASIFAGFVLGIAFLVKARRAPLRDAAGGRMTSGRPLPGPPPPPLP